MDDLEELEERFLAPAPEPAPAVSRPSPWGNLVPVLGLALSLFLTARQWPDLSYLFSSPNAVDLGGPAGWHLERARSGLFAHVSGHVASEASRYTSGFAQRELVPFTDVPILLDRPRGAPARAGPVIAEGRLESEERDPRFAKVIRYFIERDELAPPGRLAGTRNVWILAAGVRPRSWGWPAAWFVLLAVLLAFNGAWLGRRLARSAR